MTASADLGTVDLRALVNLIGDAKDDDPGPALPWALITGLGGLIPAVEVAFNQFDMRHHEFLLAQCVDDGEMFAERTELPANHLWWTETPRRNMQFWGADPPVVTRWSARNLLPEVRKSVLYQEIWSPATDCMATVLPGLPGYERRLVFWRLDGETFSERDEALLILLRPHLIAVDRDARHRRAGTPQLTPRETQVLGLVAQGLSNTEIAHALVTSLSTVRKHLEHIFERTETHSRSAAVAKMLPR